MSKNYYDLNHLNSASATLSLLAILNLNHLTMKLKIKSGKTLKQLQKEFQDEFPLLKIEFFNRPHRNEEASSKKDLQDTSLTVAEISKKQGEVAISGKTKTAELEQQFQTEFGLNVQVFRKSGNVWLETSTTDHLTLEEQQEAAKESQEQYTYRSHNFADERE